MHALAALVLATPVWGFALRPPDVLPVTEVAAQIRTDVDVDGELLEVDEQRLDAELHDDSMMEWTRIASVATLVPFATALVLGAIQLGDEYGFKDSYQQSPCATGDTILGYCGQATPWPHVVAVGATAALGLTTFVLSTQVDYERAARRDSDWRIYEVTRWVGLGMFLAQGIGGVLLANAIRFGWADEQRDWGTMRALAVAHAALGAATFGVELFNTSILF